MSDSKTRCCVYHSSAVCDPTVYQPCCDGCPSRRPTPPSHLPASPTPGSKNAHPPFSGDDPTCPKCSNVGASTKYLGFGVCQHGTGMTLGMQPNERLHRECRRCDYEWDEALAEPAQQEGTP